MIIKAQGIRKSFGTLEVLKGVDVEVSKGEVVAVVGASGAGKSTLLQILGTLSTPGGASASQAKERALNLLEEVGLSGRASHKPSELSGGEQQRVAIARAIVQSPSILFADEPSGNLDSRTKEDIHSLFFRLRDTLGQTIVIVTHDEGLAAQCDRALTMRDGLII